MKTTIKLLSFIMIFIITSCGDTTDINNNKEYETLYRTHFENSLEISGQQVWQQNPIATKLSNAYLEFKGNRNISIVFLDPADYNMITIGSGKIQNGLLSFKVNEPESSYLLDWNDLKSMFFFWSNIEIDVPEIKGNFILPLTTYNEKLSRERLLGTDFSLSQEIVIFIYVDNNCQITGDYAEGQGDGFFYYTESNLSLKLKKGWNTLCRKESYGRSGKAGISMEIKNPDCKWVIYN